MKIKNVDQMKQEIIKILEKQSQDLIEKNRPKIRSAIKPLIIDAILDCEEIKSLQNGILKYDFGLNFDPSYVIAWSIADSSRVRYIKTSAYSAGFIIEIQPGSHENLLSLKEAYQETEMGEIPWLKWLLHMGDSVIIGDFGVKYTNSGRSGGAIMIKNYNAPFRVDSNYSGTAENNFITRALNNKINEIQETAWQIIKN